MTIIDSESVAFDEVDDNATPDLPYLEPLTGEEAALAAILMDPSGLDQAEFLLTDNSKPDLCYRAKPFQWPWWRSRETRQIDQCVAAGQLVLTEDGWVPIERVEVGTRVLTHRGRWRRVLARLDQGERDVVRVRGQGVAEAGLIVTPDHKLYARRSTRGSKSRDGHTGKVLGEPEWLTPAEWDWNDGNRKMVTNWGSPSSVERLAMPEQMEPAYHAGPQNLVEDYLTEDWMWLYGLYLAEGSTMHSGVTHRICWSVHEDEAATVSARLSAVGLNHHLAKVPDEKCVVVRAQSRPVLEWLEAQGGKLAHGKRIAPWVFGAPVNLRRAVLEGAIYGDGYEPTPKGTHSVSRTYTTVSRHLALDIKVLAQTLGYAVSIWSRPPGEATIQGRLCSTREVWCVSLIVAARSPVREIDGVSWSPVKTIEPAGAAHVWDLQVEEDESFVVDGVIVHNCSRDVGKSEGMMLRCLAFSFVFPNEEMTIFTPEFTHINRIAERIESRVVTNWFYRALTRPGRSGITHRPFCIFWSNGARLISSLPQRSGIGAKGAHSVRVEVDEAQDLSPQAWKEIPNTISWEKPGAGWYIHGVSRGVRDDFYDYSTKPELGFTVHRITQMHREDWTEERRQQLIEEFGGSVDSPDYKRNVRGEHGDTSNVIFILANFMAGMDTDESSFYNLTEYTHFDVRGPEIQSRVEAMGIRHEDSPIEESSEHHALAIQQLLDFPALHTERYDVFWAGMDVGLVDDPSEILIFAEYHPDANERRSNKAAKLAVPLDGMSRLKLVNRISMRWIPAPLQADAIMWVIEEYKPKAFSMDSTGNGLPVFQELQKRAGASRMRVMDFGSADAIPIAAQDARTKQRAQTRTALTTIKGYNFSGKVIVGFDEEKMSNMKAGATPQEIADECGIKAWVKDAATDMLRGVVDTRRHLLPYDKELQRQWNAQTWQYAAATVDKYGRRKAYSTVKVHTLDAGRMMIIGHDLEPIEQFLREPPTRPRPVYDYFVQG